MAHWARGVETTNWEQASRSNELFYPLLYLLFSSFKNEFYAIQIIFNYADVCKKFTNYEQLGSAGSIQGVILNWKGQY